MCIILDAFNASCVLNMRTIVISLICVNLGQLEPYFGEVDQLIRLVLLVFTTTHKATTARMDGQICSRFTTS